MLRESASKTTLVTAKVPLHLLHLIPLLVAPFVHHGDLEERRRGYTSKR